MKKKSVIKKFFKKQFPNKIKELGEKDVNKLCEMINKKELYNYIDFDNNPISFTFNGFNIKIPNNYNYINDNDKYFYMFDDFGKFNNTYYFLFLEINITNDSFGFDNNYIWSSLQRQGLFTKFYIENLTLYPFISFFVKIDKFNKFLINNIIEEMQEKKIVDIHINKFEEINISKQKYIYLQTFITNYRISNVNENEFVEYYNNNYKNNIIEFIKDFNDMLIVYPIMKNYNLELT